MGTEILITTDLGFILIAHFLLQEIIFHESRFTVSKPLSNFF